MCCLCYYFHIIAKPILISGPRTALQTGALYEGWDSLFQGHTSTQCPYLSATMITGSISGSTVNVCRCYTTTNGCQTAISALISGHPALAVAAGGRDLPQHHGELQHKRPHNIHLKVITAKAQNSNHCFPAHLTASYHSLHSHKSPLFI